MFSPPGVVTNCTALSCIPSLGPVVRHLYLAPWHDPTLLTPYPVFFPLSFKLGQTHFLFSCSRPWLWSKKRDKFHTVDSVILLCHDSPKPPGLQREALISCHVSALAAHPCISSFLNPVFNYLTTPLLHSLEWKPSPLLYWVGKLRDELAPLSSLCLIILEDHLPLCFFFIFLSTSTYLGIYTLLHPFLSASTWPYSLRSSSHLFLIPWGSYHSEIYIGEKETGSEEHIHLLKLTS